LKVPSDFSGSAAKFDDGGDAEGDDDIVDEEENLPAAKPSNRRRGRGRLTLTDSVDAYSAQLPPPPPPAHHLHPESGAAALLSVANDRVSNMRDLHPSRPNKRTRNARSRSPSEDALIPALPAMNSEWSLTQDNHGMGQYGRNIRPPPPPGLSQQQQQEHQHPQQYHSMHPHQQQHPGHGFQYTSLFPVSNQVSLPPAFIPLEFGSSRGLPAFGSRPGESGSGPEGGSGYADLHQRMRPSESPGYNPAPYPPNANPMTRHSEHHHHHHFSLNRLRLHLLSMHSLLLPMLLLSVERIGEEMAFSGICWKVMERVDSELDLVLQLEEQEQDWIGLYMVLKIGWVKEIRGRWIMRMRAVMLMKVEFD